VRGGGCPVPWPSVEEGEGDPEARARLVEGLI
jgi:hypothetical protein